MLFKKQVAFISAHGHYMVIQYPDGWKCCEKSECGTSEGPWHEEYYASNHESGMVPGRDKCWVKQGESSGVFQGWPEDFDS